MKIPPAPRILGAGAVALVLYACGDVGPTGLFDLARNESRDGNASNTLQICHVMGNGGFRMMSVNPDAQADHVSHGDWLPPTFYRDEDGDGYGGTVGVLLCVIEPGFSTNDDDCDDDDPTSFPDATEIMGDGRDNDCDGWIDEDWASWGAAATEGARRAGLAWMTSANVLSNKCHVNGIFATSTAAAVGSTSVNGYVEQRLLGAGASASVASAWDDAFVGSWQAWANGITIPALPWYAWNGAISFALYPGSYAPPTPNLATPLSFMYSATTSALEADNLAAVVKAALGVSGADVSSAVDAFASDVAGRFDRSQDLPVTYVMGQGPVPSFNPTKLPFPVVAGPVVGGYCSGGDFPTSPWS